MDEFSDDDLDGLNVALLQELERNALEALRRQSQPPPRPAPVVIEIEDDMDVADAETLCELAQVPAQHALAGRLAAAAAPPPLPLPAYSQHSMADMPLPAAHGNRRGNPPGISYQNTAARPPMRRPTQQPFRPPTRLPGRPGSRPTPFAETRPVPGNRPAPAVSTGSQAAPYNHNRPAPLRAAAPPAPAAPTTDIAALQQRIHDLEKTLVDANGRAAIVQSRLEQSQEKHAAELASLQAQSAAKLAEQRGLVEAAKAAEAKVTTALEFTLQDRKEAALQSKKSRPLPAPTTPRKQAARSQWDVADGFDDMDLLPSPSKGAARRVKDAAVVPAMERSPSRGKRRRPPASSPVKPLETLETRTVEVVVAPPKEPDAAPLLFLQDVLGHRSTPDGPSTIELFSRYSFPSNRKQTLAFFTLQRIPTFEAAQGTTRLMRDFCHLLIGIWSQCNREEYYAPIRALVALLTHVFGRTPRSVELALDALPLLVPTAEKTALLLAKAVFDKPFGQPVDRLDHARDIDTGAIMTLLRLVVLGCLTRSGEPAREDEPALSYPALPRAAQTTVWQTITFEFALAALSIKQPPELFLGMLSLLRTGALPDSIGPITRDPNADASVVAYTLVDRITYHIAEPPRWAPPCPFSAWDGRLAALGVLHCFAQTAFGKASLALTQPAIPRIVGALFVAYQALRDRDVLAVPLHRADTPVDWEELGRAYGIGGYDLEQTLGSMACRPIDDDRDDRDDLDDTQRMMLYVASTVDLLHSLANDPLTAHASDIASRLANTFGDAGDVYLLFLAKLGFRVDPVFAGLPDETAQQALDLFQMAATPEEMDDYAAWAQQSDSVRPVAGDPFEVDSVMEM